MGDIEKVIDIEKAISEGGNKFLRSLPPFAIKTVARIICQDEMNETIYRSRHLEGVPFIDDVLKGWNVKIEIRGSENIPSTGRFVFVSNHPVGAIDALTFFSLIYRHFRNVVSPSNELLYVIPNLRPLVFGLNVFGKNTRETALRLTELFDSDTQIMMFPSGEVSRRKKGVISDPVWQKTFITKAIQSKRDIIPVHISGRNSNLFYLIANMRKRLGIKMFIESALLPREMMRQRNTTFTLTVGKAIPFTELNDRMTHHEWAQQVKGLVYDLA